MRGPASRSALSRDELRRMGAALALPTWDDTPENGDITVP
jgi:hypothetical protein